MLQKYKPFLPLAVTLMTLGVAACWPRTQAVSLEVVRPVDPSHFVAKNLVKPIETKMSKLSDGTEVLCHIITTKSVPAEHEMGRWCPRTVTDGKDKGGIWFKDGQLYDVDGPFVANLDKFYRDPRWKLTREDGSIKVTDTREAFEAAARPDVDPRYFNHCVECPASVNEWQNDEKVYVIPVNPVYRTRPTRLARGAAGMAFNGISFDPPAPVHAITGAQTIAPLDDSGGHVNPHQGYHYHTATGRTHEIKQADAHASMIGYGLDGFGVFANLDKGGKKASELDECGGHYDSTRGYHYHVGAPGENQLIRSLRGTPGTLRIVVRD